MKIFHYILFSSMLFYEFISTFHFIIFPICYMQQRRILKLKYDPGEDLVLSV